MKMRRIAALVCALFTSVCFSLQKATTQQTGRTDRPKPNKPKTTPSPAGATSPAPPGRIRTAARPRSSTAAAPAAQTRVIDAAPGFKEVTKEKFKEIYFRLGGGKSSGWTADYWQKFFEDEAKPGWKFMVEEPRSARHVRMNIVVDHKAQQYRLFFMTEESEEDCSD